MRSIARTIGITDIKEVNNEILILFDNKERINEKLVKSIISKYSKKIVFKLGERPGLSYKLKDVKHDEIVNILVEVLEYIKSVFQTN